MAASYCGNITMNINIINKKLERIMNESSDAEVGEWLIHNGFGSDGNAYIVPAHVKHFVHDIPGTVIRRGKVVAGKVIPKLSESNPAFEFSTRINFKDVVVNNHGDFDFNWANVPVLLLSEIDDISSDYQKNIIVQCVKKSSRKQQNHKNPQEQDTVYMYLFSDLSGGCIGWSTQNLVNIRVGDVVKIDSARKNKKYSLMSIRTTNGYREIVGSEGEEVLEPRVSKTTVTRYIIQSDAIEVIG